MTCDAGTDDEGDRAAPRNAGGADTDQTCCVDDMNGTNGTNGVVTANADSDKTSE